MMLARIAHERKPADRKPAERNPIERNPGDRKPGNRTSADLDEADHDEAGRRNGAPVPRRRRTTRADAERRLEPAPTPSLAASTQPSTSLAPASTPLEPEPLVFLIESNEEVAEATRDLLASIDIPSRVFHTAQEFLECPDRDRTGCLIVDVRLKGMSGLILLERLRSDGVLTPVIMTTSIDDTATAARAMKSGAFDVLKKPAEAQTLLDRVQQALDADGARQRRERGVAEIRQRYAALTDREREVLDLILSGFTSAEVAVRLSEPINHKTVESHRVKIMKKMQARNVAHLVRLAFRLKLKVLDESDWD